MRKRHSTAVEDYLRAIFEITTGAERATTKEIAERLSVNPASVTGMLKKLSQTDPPLITYKKYRGAVLTPAGDRVALEITRLHRLLELYLHEKLGYDWDEVHAEADRLEHVISETFEQKIADSLGDPCHNPHGDPIPSVTLEMPESATTRLPDLEPGTIAVVRRVPDHIPELLRDLASLGLVPGSRLQIVGHQPVDERFLRVRVAGSAAPQLIDREAAHQIYVELALRHEHTPG